MYVNKQLTDQKPVIRENREGIYYTEVIPAHYVIAIKKPDGWHYGLKIWRWDINALYTSQIAFLSTEPFGAPRKAIKAGLEAYRRIESGDHA